MSIRKVESSELLQTLTKVQGSSVSTTTTTTTPSNTTPSITSNSSTSVGPSKIMSTTAWFTTEIQQMMYGFGDCRRSLHESAVLVEEIVHQQMSSLLVQASNVAVMRGSRFIGLEEMLFLLRKDKVKLRRLLRYLDLKDLKAAALKGSGLEEDDAVDLGESKAPVTKRRRRVCYEFLSSIDQTGELTAVFDDQSVDTVKHERLIRAELMTRNMDPQQYKEFCEARQANFSRRFKSQRFKDWLMLGVEVDIKPNPQGLEVISYLAYETVAQIVDLSLLVKQDQRALPCQPETRVMAPVQHNYLDLQTSALLAALVKSPANSSPTKTDTLQSPPSTPTSGNSQAASSSLTSTATTTSTLPITSTNTAATPTTTTTTITSPTSAAAARTNKKKRKRSGPATTLDISWNSAITPGDIREAMRRYIDDIGPFASCTKTRHPGIARTRLLCT